MDEERVKKKIIINKQKAEKYVRRKCDTFEKVSGQEVESIPLKSSLFGGFFFKKRAQNPNKKE